MNLAQPNACLVARRSCVALACRAASTSFRNHGGSVAKRPLTYKLALPLNRALMLSMATNVEPLNCTIQFNVTEGAFVRLEKMHGALLGGHGFLAGVPLAVSARIAFLRGLEKIERDQERAVQHMRRKIKQQEEELV